MATRAWTGGGNNEASNPNDWSPTGLPMPGDLLVSDHGTIKVEANALFSPGTLGSSVLLVKGDVHLKLSKDANVMPVTVTHGTAHINVKDDATFTLSTAGGSAVVDLARNSEWIGGFSAFTGTMTINGGHNAKFIPNAASGATELSGGTPARVIIKADVGLGTSEISAVAGATVEVGRSVAAGQSFAANAFSGSAGPALNAPGILRIDRPHQFGGQVNLGIGEIDLIGLARADSYSYRNDVLSIYSHDAIIDKLTVHQVPSLSGSALGALAVEKTASGVAVYTEGETHSKGTLLLLHT